VRFESPWFLALALLAPAAWWWMRRAGWSRRAPRRTGVPLPTLSAAGRVPASWRVHLLPLVPLLRALAVALLALALARPQFGQGRVVTNVDAVAIQVVVDRSGSMRQQMEFGGTVLSRLDVVKRVLRQFLLGDGRTLEGRAGDMVGLIAFAGAAETLTPLVRDPNAVVAACDSINPAVERWEDGTAIGDALALASARMRRLDEQARQRKAQADGARAADPGKSQDDDGPLTSSKDPVNIRSKVIVLLTDGRNTAGERAPEDGAALARQWGIKVHVIGIGGDRAVRRIRDLSGDRTIAIPSDMDEDTLRAIADATGGIYRRADDGESLARIAAEIDQLEKTSVEQTEFTDYQERFMVPALAAAACVGLELLLGTLVLRRAPA
jgi:Ca-activated chloride channel family protein